MRLACLSVPLFPLAARLRSEPELKEQALVIVEGNGPAARVAAASRMARRAGIRPGATLAQARGRLSQLLCRPRDSTSEEAAQNALLEVAEEFSPRFQNGDPGTVYLEIGSSPEGELGRALLLAAHQAGLPGRVGIASSKLAARIAASITPSPTVVDPGTEASFLAPLPLSRLAPDLEAALQLSHWGICTIGDLARLPAAHVADRLGPAGERLHAAACGRDSDPLLPHRAPPTFQEGLELEWPLLQLEPFLFLARGALERLCQRLETGGVACRRLDLCLRLETEQPDERRIDLPSATRDVKSLLTLLRLELEKHTPGAPVTGFLLTAFPDPPRAAQLALFGPVELAPDRLGSTLARLFALLGPLGTGSPAEENRHRPEGFALRPFSPPPPPRLSPAPTPQKGLLSVRVLRPALCLEVLTETHHGGTLRPSSLRTSAPAAGSPHGRVIVASGPWRLEEGWWQDEPLTREYWDVELANGALYRIYRDPDTNEWYADGVYD